MIIITVITTTKNKPQAIKRKLTNYKSEVEAISQRLYNKQVKPEIIN